MSREISELSKPDLSVGCGDLVFFDPASAFIEKTGVKCAFVTGIGAKDGQPVARLSCGKWCWLEEITRTVRASKFCPVVPCADRKPVEKDIQRMWTLSTAHVSQTDMSLLPILCLRPDFESANPLISHSYDEGAYVMLGTYDAASMLAFGYSEAFLSLVSLAAGEFDVLRLDCDGVIDPSLPTFDW